MLGLIMFCLVCGALIFAMDSNSKAKMYKRALEEKIREEVNTGKIAFGFTPQASEQVIKIVAENINF